MKFSKQEIALAKKLHELGVEKKIEYGDWYVWSDVASWSPNVHELISDSLEDETAIPLWTWADAREWLREKEWRVSDYYSTWDNEFEITIANRWDKELFEEGKTDLEAILKCMVGVLAERE